MMTEPHSTFRVVSPEYASRLLGMNIGNRKVSRQKVEMYAAEMRNGRWQTTGEPIQIDTHGVLINGQHRLLAIIESQCSLLLNIVSGVDPAAKNVIDTGKKRTACDAILMAGHKHAKTLAAAAKLVHVYQKRTITSMSRQQNLPTHTDILNIVEGNRLLAKCVNDIPLKKGGILPPGNVAFLLYIFSLSDGEKAMAFIEGLVFGYNLAPDSPIVLIRNRLISNADSKAKIGTVEKLALTIKAWNAYRQGVKLKQLKWVRASSLGYTKESFPIAI